uniref:CSON009361 protein n=1 Tax=Culicoides sonorensis TaxID=179676 RepID=A0A336LXH1_CULSO
MDSINDLSANYLQKAFTSSATENVVTSPLSLASLLYLLWVGARGSTQSSIGSTLKINPNLSEERNRIEFTPIFEKLNSDPLLKSASKIFLNKEFNVTEPFDHLVEILNFNNVQEVTNSVNSWIESFTNGKIKKLIDESLIKPDTVMVLLNALYFKGLWKNPFTYTKEDDFVNIDGSQRRIMFMNVIFRYRHTYLRELQAQVLELPYQNSDIVMLICLPNDPKGIFNLLKNLPSVQRTILTTKLDEKYLSATLPRFKIETALNLNGILKELGMGQAFADNADFSNLLKPGNGPAKVSAIVQKTFVEVDEKGTESAGGSGALIIPRMSLEDFNSYRQSFF